MDSFLKIPCKSKSGSWSDLKQNSCRFFYLFGGRGRSRGATFILHSSVPWASLRSKEDQALLSAISESLHYNNHSSFLQHHLPVIWVRDNVVSYGLFFSPHLFFRYSKDDLYSCGWSCTRNKATQAPKKHQQNRGILQKLHTSDTPTNAPGYIFCTWFAELQQFCMKCWF